MPLVVLKSKRYFSRWKSEVGLYATKLKTKDHAPRGVRLRELTLFVNGEASPTNWAVCCHTLPW